MTEKEREKAIIEIINHYGKDSQIDICIEELSELTKALLKYRRANNPVEMKLAISNIIEEIADVKIMSKQMEKLFFCEAETARIIDLKIQRQLKRMTEE